MRSSPKHLVSTASLFFLIALCATRLFGMTHHSLWYDEGYTLNLVDTHSFSEFLKLFSSYTVSEHLQPLYYFFMYAWSRAAGDSDLAMRLPSAVFSIVSGLILLSLVRMLAPKRQEFGTALLTLFAVSSYSIYYAQEARPYAMLQMLSFALIALWIDQRRLLLSVYETRSRISKISFCIVAVLCVLGSAFTAMLVLCVSIAELAMLRSVRRWWIVWGAAIVASSVVVQGYILCLYEHHVSGGTRNFIVLRQSLWLNMPYVFSGLLFGSTLPPGPQALHGAGKLRALLSAWPILALSLFSVALTIAAIYHLLRAPKALPKVTNTFALATAMYAALLFCGFGWLGRLNVLPRHGSAMFAMLVILIVLCSVPRWKEDRRWRLVYGLALGSVFACNVLSVWEYFSNATFLKDDYRATARQMATHPPVQTFLIQGQPVLLRHYGASAINATTVEPARLSGFIQSRTAVNEPVRLIVNRYRGYLWDHVESVPSVLTANYDCKPEAQFSYMDMDLCSARTDGTTEGVTEVPVALEGVNHDR